MTQEEILEGNKLIADFMELDYSGKLEYCWRPGTSMPLTEKQLQYDTTWNWLIPVIKKCIELKIYASDWGNHLHDGLLFCNLEQCYESVVEFIKNKSK
jgi:hypothetical protein